MVPRAFLAATLIAGTLVGQTLPFPEALETLRGLRLTDQHGAEDSLEAHRGSVVVVVVVDARRLRTIKAWERDLRERFEALEVLRIAEVPTDTATTLERVAAKLREQVPEGVSVLIDLESRWARELELDTSRPNLLLVDADGRLRAIHAGRHEPGLAAVVAGDLEVLVAAS